MEMEKQESFMHVTEEDRQTVRSKTPTTKLLSFTFIPAVRRLPIKAQVIPRGDNGQPSGRSHEYLGLSRGKATEETMVEDGVFKAEIVYVGDSDEGEGDHREKHHTAGTQGDDSKKQGAQVQQYKIKSSYKAFAAIPTNTLLLEQQAIDEEVERQILPEATGDGSVTETHAEMCSPAELRQQSAELYAAIDQVLDEPLPMRRSQSAPMSLQKLVDTDAPKRVTTLPRSAGRETKYATFHLLPPGPTERQLTKPGVIRPVSVTPRLPEEEEEEEEYRANPFRQYLEELSDGELQKPPHPIVTIHENEALSSKELTNTGSGFRRTDGSKSLANQKLGKETIPEKDSPTNELLQIIEREDGDQDQKSTLGTEGSTVSTFNSSQIKMELRETHI
ncbi:uncharacterized protein mlip isoform X4 [Amia ocellicauda]|uniref:uncharacterized protein mlip isoform X4 n=1 Tax=Amia ocellicauda TaxID=2972642 RepID=UPI003463B946